MKKMLVLTAIVFMVIPAFCFTVKSAELTSKYGVSYEERQRGYVEKGDYIFKYIGNGTWDVQNITSNSTGSSRNANRVGGIDSTVVLVIVVVSIIHIILTYCVYKKKGGGYACFYFFLAPVAIAVLLLVLCYAGRNIGSIGGGERSTGIGYSGGGGSCGTAYNCSGGGGKCGTSYNCSGGGGKCGTSYGCSGR